MNACTADYAVIGSCVAADSQPMMRRGQRGFAVAQAAITSQMVFLAISMLSVRRG
jgi:hypothetical protein